MSAELEGLLPPKTPTAFESLCLDLWKEIWQDTSAQMNGRNGQPQAGVDVFGQEQGKWVGVQCKQKDNLLWCKVTVKELEAEVLKAQEFKPALSHFILATTGPADIKVQERARQLTAEHRSNGLFGVSIFSWREIWKELCDRPKLLRELGPRYWPALWQAFAQEFATKAVNLHQLTPPVPDFIDRKAKLDELRLKVKQGGVAITGLRGMGGAGKTELARRLAAEFKAYYRDAQIELNLKGVDSRPLSPADVLSTVLRLFRPPSELPERTQELAALLRETLEGKRALLLLDNAKDAYQIAPLLPLPPGCMVIVTSRQHFTLPGLDAVDLGVMEPREACALLLKITPRISHQANALAKACGRLPLALRLAASFLNVNKHVAPADYLVQLRQSCQRIQLLDTAREITAVELGLEASFSLSFQQLLPERQRLFTRLAAFPSSFDRAALEAVWTVGMPSAGAALDGLLQLSLLEWNKETQRFELHDLLREFARNHAKLEELKAAKRLHAEHFKCVGNEAESLYLKGGQNVARGLALFDRERVHLKAAFDWLKLQPDKKSATLLVLLVNAVAYTSSLRFHPRQRIRWRRAQAKAARSVDDWAGEAIAFNNLGLAYAELGNKRKAIEAYEKSLVIAREIDNKLLEGKALGNLGNAYLYMGQAHKAIEFYEQQLSITRNLHDQRGEGNALGNLGLAHADLYQTHKAIEFYKQWLVIARDIGDRRGEGNALGNLGLAYTDLGQAQKAIELSNEALVIARDIGDRYVEGNILGNLGHVYRKSGEPRKAIEFYEQWLVIAREIGDRRGQGSSLWNSADEVWKLGGQAQAIARAEKALRFFEAIQDPRAAKVRSALAEWRKAGP